MTTATEAMEADRHHERMKRAYQEFVYRWGSGDPHRVAEFTAELHMLMEMVHRDAVDPFVKMIGLLPLQFPERHP